MSAVGISTYCWRNCFVWVSTNTLTHYLYGKTYTYKNNNNKFFSIYNYLFRFYTLFGFQWTFVRLLTLVEMMGFEPMTPCLQGRCSPSWATPPFYWVVCCSPFYFTLFSIKFLCLPFFSKKVSGRTKWTRTTVKTYPFATLREKPLSLCNGFVFRLSSMVGPSGLEPPTSCLSGTRSNLLSYDPMWLVWRFVHTRLFFRFGEGFASFPSSVSALSYFPVQLPVKYLRHCRA